MFLNYLKNKTFTNLFWDAEREKLHKNPFLNNRDMFRTEYISSTARYMLQPSIYLYSVKCNKVYSI